MDLPVQLCNAFPHIREPHSGSCRRRMGRSAVVGNTELIEGRMLCQADGHLCGTAVPDNICERFFRDTDEAVFYLLRNCV